MIKEEYLVNAYKIDEILIITKVYPYDNIINNEISDERISYLDILSIDVGQDNNCMSYCKKNLIIICKCHIYTLAYTICIPCIVTNLCINISCNAYRCINMSCYLCRCGCNSIIET
jgi:hypothetical protein